MVCDGIPVSTLLSSAYEKLEKLPFPFPNSYYEESVKPAIDAADGNKDGCVSKTEALACFAGQGAYANKQGFKDIFVGEWMDLADQYVEAQTPEALRFMQNSPRASCIIGVAHLTQSNYYRGLALSGVYSTAARDHVLWSIGKTIKDILRAQLPASDRVGLPEESRCPPGQTVYQQCYSVSNTVFGPSHSNYYCDCDHQGRRVRITMPCDSEKSQVSGSSSFGHFGFSWDSHHNKDFAVASIFGTGISIQTYYDWLVSALEGNPTEDSKHKILDLMITFKSYSQLSVYTDMVNPYHERLTALYQQERNPAIKSKLGQLL